MLGVQKTKTTFSIPSTLKERKHCDGSQILLLVYKENIQ